MMKKAIMLGAVLALCAPVFAAEEQAKEAPQRDFRPGLQQGHKGPRHDMHGGMQKGMFVNKADLEKMKEAREKHKADAEELEKLVQNYKKAKKGSKKQAVAKEEIGIKLGKMREEQIQNRREKIEGFEKRLEEMKSRLADEEKPEAKDAWIQDMTEKVIESDGKFNPAFKVGHKGHDKGGFGGPKEGDQRKGPQGPEFDGEDHPLPMPPAPAEEK